MWRCGVKYELNWFKLIRFAEDSRREGLLSLGKLSAVKAGLLHKNWQEGLRSR